MLIKNLLIGLPTMAVCLLLQAVLVAFALRYYSRRKIPDPESVWSIFPVVVGVMIILVVGNVAQVVTWGVIFVLLGEFSLLSEAIYHSAVNFATLGYGDIVMSDKHKLLGPLEAINGVLMIGVSTAALMSAFHDSMKRVFQE